MISFTGQEIDGYRIGNLIGDGGMGEVYLAEKEGQLAAFKIIRFEMQSDPHIHMRFAREIHLMTELHHPHIVELFGSGTKDNCLYLFMRYIPGETLYQRMQYRKFSPMEAWQVIKPIASALQYMHKLGMIHRDIKPENILLEEDTSSVFLCDYGLAKKPGYEQLTVQGTTLGTPLYMSPEASVNPDSVDRRSDIYSLGCLTYELVLGVLPFFKKTSHLTSLAHVREPVPAPVSLRPNFPLPLQEVLLKVLEKNPDNRYQSADEFANAFEQALAGISMLEKLRIYWDV